MIRFAIDPDEYSVGKPVPDILWEKIVREFFIGYGYVGFSGIKGEKDLGEEKDVFNLVPLQPLKIHMKWPESVGGDKVLDEFVLFSVSQEFLAHFCSVPLRSWTLSNFPFEKIYFFKDYNDVNEMVYVEGLDNSFTVFSENGHIPINLLNADENLQRYCHIYNNGCAKLVV